jgi:hypothetical protein
MIRLLAITRENDRRLVGRHAAQPLQSNPNPLEAIDGVEVSVVQHQLTARCATRRR